MVEKGEVAITGVVIIGVIGAIYFLGREIGKIFPDLGLPSGPRGVDEELKTFIDDTISTTTDIITGQSDLIKEQQQTINDALGALQSYAEDVANTTKRVTDVADDIADAVVLPKQAMDTIYDDYVKPHVVEPIVDSDTIQSIKDAYQDLKDTGFTGTISGGGGATWR